MPQGRSNDPREFVQWKQHFVLLIDGSKRRDERAASLRQVGVVVHCVANGTSAAALWEPEKYHLVLFEFSQAEIDVRPFCEKLMQNSPRQRIGMYCAEAPFIVTPRIGSITSSALATVQRPGVVTDPLQDAFAAAAEQQAVEADLAADKRASSVTVPRSVAQQPISDRRQRTLAAVARQKNGRNGLAQAAQEIAALRWRNSKSVTPVRPSIGQTERENHATVAPNRESHATIAARVLGGE